MPLSCGQTKLGRVAGDGYQPRSPPAITADDTSLVTDLRIETSSGGTDGRATLYPFRVIIQGVSARSLRDFLTCDPRQVAVVVWALWLCSGAVALALGLLAAGGTIGPVVPIAALCALGFLGERQGVRLDRS